LQLRSNGLLHHGAIAVLGRRADQRCRSAVDHLTGRLVYLRHPAGWLAEQPRLTDHPIRRADLDQGPPHHTKIDDVQDGEPVLGRPSLAPPAHLNPRGLGILDHRDIVCDPASTVYPTNVRRPRHAGTAVTWGRVCERATEDEPTPSVWKIIGCCSWACQ